MLIENPASAAAPLLSRASALSLLQPYLETLNECIDGGWSAWKKDYAHKVHILDARSRAAIVYAEIFHRAVASFQQLEGVKVLIRPGSLMIYIGEDITLRFKKMRTDGRCSNIRTVIQRRFLAQFQLPGMLDGTLVHAGYQLDDLQQDIVRKAIVCQLGKQVLWDIDISGTPAELVAMPPIEPTEKPSVEPRFVAKGTQAQQPASVDEKRG
jgi:hypothetical protein